MQQKLEEQNLDRTDKYYLHKISTADDHNDKLLLTYTVAKNEDGLGHTYVVKLKTGNAYAENEEDKIHE